MSAAYPRALQRLSVEQILDPQPLTVDPDTAVAAVVEQMSQTVEQTCHRSEIALHSSSTALNCALVMAGYQLLGIFTTRDLVQLVAQGMDLNAIAVSAVMTRPVIVLKRSQAHSIFTVLATLKQHQIHQLPIVDEVGNLLGIVTQTSLLKMLEPAEVLAEVEQLQQLSEAQTARLNQANQQLQQANQAVQSETAERQRLEVALHHANQVLEERVGIQAAQLVQTNEALRRERDFIAAVLDTVGALVTVLDQAGRIVRFNRTCEHVSGYRADEVQGQLIWDALIPPKEQATVRAVFQQLTQSQSANQYENYWVSKDGTRRLISWSNTTLKNAAGDVQYVIGTGIDVTSQRQTEQILARQYRQGHLLGEITRKIRDSLEIEDILQTAVTEVRKLLACDRVVVIKCDTHQTGRVIQESIRSADETLSLLNQVVSDLALMAHPPIDTPQVCVCQDLNSAPCSLYSADFLKQYGVRACIEVAIYVGNQFWGVITASQGDRPHQWEAFEIDLMQQLANQMGVALSQAQLLHNLEFQVAQRTQQLIQTNHQLEREIQERIQTENDLRESQQKLAGILDNADEAIISIDSQQRIVLYNQGAERIFGYTFAEAHHQPLDILLPAAFQQIHRQHVRHFAASSQTSQSMAHRQRDVLGRRQTGEVFPAAASISKLQTKSGQLFTVILKDITDQRQSEAALRRSEEQLRLTTNALPALICYVDTEQRYCFNNQTYEDWFKVPIADLRGRYVWEVMGSEYYAQVQPHIDKALLGQRVSFEAEITIPDGRSRYLLATYIPEVNDQGKVKGFFGLTNDISDRKATEQLKDEFVSVVGHELRTPLTSIHGSLKLLATQRLGTLVPQGQEILAIALKNTERLTRLINDVLDLERIESGQVTLAMQTCNVAELMIPAAQAMQTMANDHGVQLLVTPLDATIWADPDHMAQVLTNLLSNAIKFSSADSTVWLNAVNRETDLMLYVKDQGRGIPPDKLEIIFERFQQVDASDSRQRGGTGLGLAICKQIMRQHGGQIWAESTIGEGSTVFLTLPIRE
ncbi:MAG: PAS domain S-box protein [Cyanobacteria bacterium J06639_16]